MGVTDRSHSHKHRQIMRMRCLVFLVALVPSLNALCALQGCDKWYSSAKNDAKIAGACAVIFDENCCKGSETFYVIKKDEEGKLCGTVSKNNPFSSCKGPALKDDVESIAVMPGCTLEVWDKGDGLKDAKEEEAKSANAGNIRDNKDRYDRNKLVFTAVGTPNFVEEIDDDFDDMDEDIESYRCKC